MLTSRKQLIFLIFLSFLLTFGLRFHQVGLHPVKYKYNGSGVEEGPVVFKNLNSYLTNRVTEIVDHQPEGALLSGIILGAKNALPPDFKQALVRTSTIHIVVVSGENLSLLSSFIMVLAPFLGRKKTIFLNILVVLGFTLLTGVQVPVLRAAIMVLLSFSAQILGKEGESPWILFLAAGLMLVFQPNWIFSVSFQLSFLATAGVLLLSPLLVRKFGALPEIIRQDLAVTLAAQALTWPVIALSFGQFSVIGVVANLFVLWTIPPIMITGIGVMLISLINLQLASFLAIIPKLLLSYFTDIINFFGSFSFAQINSVELPLIIALGYYTLILSVFLYLHQSSREVVVGS